MIPLYFATLAAGVAAFFVGVRRGKAQLHAEYVWMLEQGGGVAL